MGETERGGGNKALENVLAVLKSYFFIAKQNWKVMILFGSSERMSGGGDS